MGTELEKDIVSLELGTEDDGEVVEAAVSAQDAANAAKADPDFLAGLAMSHSFVYCWPPVFRAIWFWLVKYVEKSRAAGDSVEDCFAKLAIGLPRGFGKTTVIKLFILYCILYTDRKFILVFSATAQHARNILADVVDMLDEPNIKAIFGDWRLGVTKDTQDLVVFGFRGRNIVLAGLGAGGSARGLNIKHARPDIIIFEDIQTREDADSQAVSDNLYKWMLGTAMKTKSPWKCLTVFIANMYPTPNSILRKLKANPQWTKFIAGGILEDGTSLWEELHPIEQLYAEYMADLLAGHPELFYSEVLNDENAALNDKVRFNALPEYPFQDDDIPAGKFIIIDPSNDKANSDAVSIGYFEVHGLQKPVLREVIEGRFSPGDTIKEAIKLGMKHNCYLVVIEANAFQYSLLYWSNFICSLMGISGFEWKPIYSGKLSKNTRILTMFKEYAAGDLYVHPSCKSQVHAQIAGFRPMKTDNVDGILDLLTYAPKVIAEYAPLVEAQMIETQQLWESAYASVPTVEELSCF